MCRVSKPWRDILNNSYIWRKKALSHGILDTSYDLEEDNDIFVKNIEKLPSFCELGKFFRRVLKQRRNFQKGKFQKRNVPSLYKNIYEETESFSICMDFYNGKMIFGSRTGSIILWIPNLYGGRDFLKKFTIREAVKRS